MKYHEMLTYVSTTTGTDRARAEKITRAFLETLGQRLPNEEARHLAAQLPGELEDTLHPTAPDVKKLSSEEFLTRFARLADLSNEQAGDMAAAVWHALEQAVSAGEFEDVRSTLPKELIAALR
jgi:uncharacterized protein (DUF2267 family)